MNEYPNTNDKLLARLLSLADREFDGDTATPHLDESTLAEFCSGVADEATRSRVIAHLDACPTCRKAASLWMSLDEPNVRDQGSASVTLPVILHRRDVSVRWVAWATAACVLLATGTLFWMSTRTTTELALARAGRLTDFGYEPGGIVARGTLTTAKQATNNAQSPPIPVGDNKLVALLNRGHAELASGEWHAARRSFEEALHRAPDNPWASLGLGLSDFLLDDLDAAERAIRKALSLDEHFVAARENLAITLEELDRKNEALAEWQRLLGEPLSGDQRAQVEKQIKRLQALP